MALLEKVKANLIVTHNEDDALLEGLIAAAISYAEGYQHLGADFYAWERSGRSDETVMGEEKKKTPEKMLQKRQTKGSESWIRGESGKGR